MLLRAVRCVCPALRSSPPKGHLSGGALARAKSIRLVGACRAQPRGTAPVQNMGYSFPFWAGCRSDMLVTPNNLFSWGGHITAAPSGAWQEVTLTRAG